ncbi:DUF4259 domain-containing protein [Hymenobacter sp. H14-R3]|uniref:DUF4259 domain-containing protein n=1 Tax=Hymenobacter sp. H14-R3 TaxID=3046308 RepID=UPI0024B97625|nr:DUF4259 domain-containing protein [Hymenobacter sp. H14-R3]MDJ0365728.1 DUF4259 domain-containing protein [Hymenobacter sp. H14-R3]
MGAWGFKALDSDNGLDVVDSIEEYISIKYPNSQQITLTLSEILSFLKGSLFGQSFEEVDFLYDNSSMALTELYLLFKTTGSLPYENEDDETKNLKTRVIEFIGDEKSFFFLLQYLEDIQNNVPDEDGEREIVELWKKSKNYDKWSENLNALIKGLKEELKIS